MMIDLSHSQTATVRAPGRAVKDAFTLIELLVVIAIIAILDEKTMSLRGKLPALRCEAFGTNQSGYAGILYIWSDQTHTTPA